MLTLTITALDVGQMGYENAIAIAIGSNIGSAVVAVIGSIKANSDGKGLMLGHVIFNIASAMIMLCFIIFIISVTDVVANFLDEKSIQFVDSALIVLAKEMAHL